MNSRYELVMRTGPNPGQKYPLDQPEMFVGRDLSCDIVVNDSEVSRKHAKIYVFGQGFVIEDLGSTNGTFINGQRISGPHSMIPGEMVSFGDHVSFIFQVGEYDEDATRVSAPPADYVPAPPAAQKPYSGQMPTPQQVQQMPQTYAGSVPPSAAPPVKPKKKRRIWLIILILFLLIICGCIVFWVVVDQLNWYCDLFPGIMNSLFGAGSCP